MNFNNLYWPLFKTLIPLIILVVIAALIKNYIESKNKNQKNLFLQPIIHLESYKVITSLLTPAEQQLYKRLSEIINNHYLIFSKVRMADILFSPTNQFDNQTSSKHIDFIICDPTNFNIKAGIELDDSTHNNDKAQYKDEFKNQIFKQIKIPLIRILPGTPTNEIKNKIKVFLS